jgi:anti-sigma regulatory factor (Ser/Thr protein kinase)/PAS domain-containing protein
MSPARAQGGAARAAKEVTKEAASVERPLHFVLLEPRQQQGEALKTLLRTVEEATGGALPQCDMVTSLDDVRQALSERSYDACLLPLLSLQRGVENMWEELDRAAYSVGYLFYAHMLEEGTAGAGKKARDTRAVPYLCLARFGFHLRVLALLRLLDRNVLEVHQADQAPHERYRKILNRISEGFWDVGPDLRVVYANSQFKAIFGDNQPIGKYLLDYFEPADQARVRSILSDQQEGIIIPFTLRLPNGRTIRVDPSPRFGESGRYLGGSAIISEVSSTDKTADETLARERELYTLYTVASTLSRALGVNDLVGAATARLREQLNVDATCVWMRKPDDDMHCIDPQGLPDASLLDPLLAWCLEQPTSKPAYVVRDTSRSRSEVTRRLHALGFTSMAVIPLLSDTERFGFLWLATHDSSVMNRAWVSLMISIGHQLSLAINNSLSVEARIREEARRKQFYREAVYALTNGKLSLCEKDEIAPTLQQGRQIFEMTIAQREDVQTARRHAEQYLAEAGIPSERYFDIATCVSEAATNTLLHGKGGRMQVFELDGAVRFALTDHGPGINFSELPRALLKRGYSTAVSMGLGYTLILEMMDAIHLATDQTGTTLIMDAVVQQKNDELDAWLERFSE